MGDWKDAGKTPGALRTVTLSAPAIRALKEVMTLVRNEPIFTRQRADGSTSTLAATRVEARPEPRRSEAPPPLPDAPHLATLALAQGCTLEWIAEQMGHTDIRTTRKHYARFVKKVDDRMRSLLDQLEEKHDERDAADA